MFFIACGSKIHIQSTCKRQIYAHLDLTESFTFLSRRFEYSNFFLLSPNVINDFSSFLCLTLDVCDDRTACKALLKLNFCFHVVLGSCFASLAGEARAR
jgi:hypothetical protein